MWFDVSAAVVQLQAVGDNAPAVIRMTENNAPKIAEIAEVAAPCAQNLKPGHDAQTGGRSQDAGKYLDFLHLHGPSTYGAAAVALGWGATRAWQAEAQLVAAGLVHHDNLGKAEPKLNKSVSVAVRNQCLNPPVAPKIQAILPEASRLVNRKPNART